MAEYIDWPVSAGTYRYWFLDKPRDSQTIKNVAGNYMFVRKVETGWRPVYIGIADDLQARIPNHERWDDAIAAGASHVMAHSQANSLARNNEEAELVAYWQPPLNTQLRRPKTAA